jgi:hypothetical protein
MKKFTVRDFITYNNPCFSCGESVRIEVSGPGYLEPNINPEMMEVDLRVNYYNALRLSIRHKDNRILTNDKQMLIEYLDNHELVLDSICHSCGSNIRSTKMVFHVDQGFVETVEIAYETLVVKDLAHQRKYAIRSDFSANQSQFRVFTLSKDGETFSSKLDLPLMPKSMFKSKRHLLDKCKTLITFS